MPPAARLKKGTAQRLRPANSARIFINWFWYYSSTSICLRRRVLKRVPRRDLDQLIPRAFLSTGSGTIACNMHIVHVVYYIIFQTDEKKDF